MKREGSRSNLRCSRWSKIKTHGFDNFLWSPMNHISCAHVKSRAESKEEWHPILRAQVRSFTESFRLKRSLFKCWKRESSKPEKTFYFENYLKENLIFFNHVYLQHCSQTQIFFLFLNLSLKQLLFSYVWFLVLVSMVNIYLFYFLYFIFKAKYVLNIILFWFFFPLKNLTFL